MCLQNFDSAYIEGYSNGTDVQDAGEPICNLNVDAGEASEYINIGFRVSPNTSYWVNATATGSSTISLEHWIEDET